MPVSRNYGGYSSYTPYQPAASVYATSYTSYQGRYGHGTSTAGMSGGGGGEESTPGVAAAAGMRSLYGAYGVLAGGSGVGGRGGSGYRYLTRDWYNDGDADSDAANIRTINTEDLDVETERAVERRHAIPGAIKRDTAADLGERGQQVVRIVTARQKNNFGRKDDGQELTLGQRLALKHLLVDPKRDGEESEAGPPPAKPFVRRSSLAHMTTPRVTKLIREEEEVEGRKGDEGSSDDEWTWETCSSSEEGPDVKYFPPTPPTSRKDSVASSSYNRAKTTDLSGALAKVEKASELTDVQATPKMMDSSSMSRQSLDRWSRAMFTEKKEKKGTLTPSSSFSSNSQAAAAAAASSKPPISPRGVITPTSAASAAAPATDTATAAVSTASPPTAASIPPSKSFDKQSVTLVEPIRYPPKTISFSKEETPASTPAADSAKATLEIPSSCPVGRGASPSVSSTHSEDSSGDNTTPAFARSYKCPGMSRFSSDEEEEEEATTSVNRGWRRGQPPRSDVVVKLTAKPKEEKRETEKRKSSAPVISYNHSRTMNKLLTSSLDLSMDGGQDQGPLMDDGEKRGEDRKGKKKAVTQMPIEIEDRTEKVASLRKVKEDPSQALRQEQVSRIDSKRPPLSVVDRIVENVPRGEEVLIRPTNDARREVELKIVEPELCQLKQEKAKKKVKVSIVQTESDSKEGRGEKVVQAKMEFSLRGTRKKQGEEDEALAAMTVAHALDQVITQVVSTERKLEEQRKVEEEAQKKEVTKEVDKGQGVAADRVGVLAEARTEEAKEEEGKSERQQTVPAAPAPLLSNKSEMKGGVNDKGGLLTEHLVEKKKRKQLIPATPMQQVKVSEISMEAAGGRVALLEGTVGGGEKVSAEKLVMRNKAKKKAGPEVEEEAAVQTAAPEKPPKKKVKKAKAEGKKKAEKKIKKPTETPKPTTPSAPPPPKNEEEKDEVPSASSTAAAALEVPLMASQLERLPSPMRQFFEQKSKAAAGEEVRAPQPPREKPKYWDNVPTPCDPAANPMLQLARMKAEARQHREKVLAEQDAALGAAGDAAEEPWYDEEPEETREQLRGYERAPSNHHKPESERRTPEENMAIVRLYGGAQFAEGHPGDTPTPRRLLLGGNRNKKKRKANGVDDACGSNCHRKCEKLMANLCGINHQILSDTLHQLRKEKSQSALLQRQESLESDTKSSTPERGGLLASPARLVGGDIHEEEEEEDDESEEEEEQSKGHRKKESAGPPPPPSAAAVKNRPKFRKYGVDDFAFLKVLGKGSFGKVLLAELRSSRCYYAVKCLKKDVVLEDDDIECTMIERKVLTLGCKHPFICHLFCTFQTNSHLFFVMEYLNGGDLMFHIQQTGRFDAERARFYAAEILLALRFLHKKGIVYRDLKLDNLLLDYEGHIRIADFGMCKLQIYLDKTADTFCGTPDYMAPEIIKGLKYTYCVDWWSFGVLLYEMLIGQSPFNGCDEDELFWSICNEQPYFPRFLSREAKHILQLLLEKDPSKRLGVPGCAAGHVCEQPFFKSIDFAKVEKKEAVPPYKPKLRHALDVSYFDEAFTQEVAKLTPVNEDFLASVNQMQFKGFSYTNPNYTTK